MTRKTAQNVLTRKALGDITNIQDSKASAEKGKISIEKFEKPKKPQIEKTFLEDNVKKTSNYVRMLMKLVLLT